MLLLLSVGKEPVNITPTYCDIPEEIEVRIREEEERPWWFCLLQRDYLVSTPGNVEGVLICQTQPVDIVGVFRATWFIPIRLARYTPSSNTNHNTLTCWDYSQMNTKISTKRWHQILYSCLDSNNLGIWSRLMTQAITLLCWVQERTCVFVWWSIWSVLGNIWKLRRKFFQWRVKINRSRKITHHNSL